MTSTRVRKFGRYSITYPLSPATNTVVTLGRRTDEGAELHVLGLELASH